MPTVSLNSFLKILSKSTPQKSQEYGRYLQSGGYDFYWRLKDAAHSLTVGGETFAECSKPILETVREVERKHNLAALKTLDKWVKKESITSYFECPVGMCTSPEKFLTIKLEPAFGYERDGQKRIVHIWMSQSISLPRVVAGCGLYLLQQHLCVGDHANCVATILDLRRRELFVAAALPANVGPMVASELAWADGFFKAHAKAAVAAVA